MPEISQITLSHRELTEMMIKAQNLHEGKWRLIVVFGIQGANLVPPGSNEIFPAAVIPIQKIGLQKAKDDEKEDSITVDAAKVNPLPKK